MKKEISLYLYLICLLKCIFFGKLRLSNRREKNKPGVLGDALSCRASPLRKQSTGLFSGSPLAGRLKASSTSGRFGTPSQTLPEALPLDSAKGTLSLWNPGVIGCAVSVLFKQSLDLLKEILSPGIILLTQRSLKIAQQIFLLLVQILRHFYIERHILIAACIALEPLYALFL